MDDDDDTQVYKDHGDALTIAYQSGYYDGKKAAQPAQEPWRESASDYERGFIDGMQKQAQSSVDKAVNKLAQPAQEQNFCPRCGKRTKDIHTCTPPQENT
jgi:NADH pyrophosphatase NudC (nudix superfamily)